MSATTLGRVTSSRFISLKKSVFFSKEAENMVDSKLTQVDDKIIRKPVDSLSAHGNQLKKERWNVYNYRVGTH